jgi:hypothetical protein
LFPKEDNLEKRLADISKGKGPKNLPQGIALSTSVNSLDVGPEKKMRSRGSPLPSRHLSQDNDVNNCEFSPPPLLAPVGRGLKISSVFISFITPHFLCG